MKKLLLILAMVCLLSVVRLGAAELNVVQTACNILLYEDECRVYCCAQVHNDSDHLVALEQGTFRLLDGEDIVAEDMVERLWPYFLDPGGDGYVFQTMVFYPDEDGNLYVPTITGLIYQMDEMMVPVSDANETLASEMTIEKTPSGGYVMICHLENTAADVAWNPLIVYGLYTAGGSMLYADGLSLDNIGINSGSALDLRFTVNPQIASQWESYGVEPAEVRVRGYYRRESD